MEAITPPFSNDNKSTHLNFHNCCYGGKLQENTGTPSSNWRSSRKASGSKQQPAEDQAEEQDIKGQQNPGHDEVVEGQDNAVDENKKQHQNSSLVLFRPSLAWKPWLWLGLQGLWLVEFLGQAVGQSQAKARAWLGPCTACGRKFY